MSIERRAYVLYELDMFTLPEIARIMKLSESLIRKYMGRGLPFIAYGRTGKVDMWDVIRFAENRWSNSPLVKHAIHPDDVRSEIERIRVERMRAFDEEEARKLEEVKRLYEQPLKLIKGDYPNSRIKTPHRGAQKHLKLC